MTRISTLANATRSALSKPLLQLLLCLGALLMVGCSSLPSLHKPDSNSITLTQASPDELKQRNVYLPEKAFNYELDELTGAVLVQYQQPVDGKRWAISRQITTPGVALRNQPMIKPVRFEGFVAKPKEKLLRALAYGAPNKKGEALTHFAYSDIRSLSIDMEQLNTKALTEEANLPKQENVQAKYYVTAATLGVVHRRALSPFESQNTANSAMVSTWNGEQYSAGKDFDNQLVISLKLVPMSTFATPRSEDDNQASEVSGLFIDL